MMPTLLQKAEKAKLQSHSTTVREETIAEEMELVLAWATDKITPYQVREAMKFEHTGSNTRFYCFVATRLREAVRRGVLKGVR